MKNYYYNLWDRLERISTLKTDPPGERRRKLTLVVIAILCCLTGIITGTRNLIISARLTNVLIPYTFTAIVGIGTLTYFYTKKFPVILYSFLIMILLIPVFFQWSVGGFTGDPGTVTIIIWAVLAPLGSLMFQDFRKALRWFIIYICLVLILLLFDQQLKIETPPFPHSELMVDQGINIIPFSFTIFLTMLYFVKAFQREHSRAEKLVVDLTETNNELESTLAELKLTQSELVQSEKMASLGKLAAGIAHEINNPIGALKSAADVSTRCITKMERFFKTSKEFTEIEEDADFRNLFQILKNNSKVFLSATDRVANTVSSFKDFARLDGAEFEKIDVNQAIDNTLMLIRQEIKAGISVVKEYEDIPPVACYPGELNQVLMNLLINSAQAIEGQGKITIRTSVRKGNLYIQITDTGVGISAEQMQGLFDPKFTKKGSRVKAELGLFTSYNIVQKHRGNIKVESEIGQGSIFTVVLPTNLDEIIHSE